MTVPTYDDTLFRSQFPAFADETVYPEAQLQGYWTMATAYINKYGGPGWCDYDQLVLAINLMAAHLAASFTLINAGIPSVLVQGSTEGSVSVTLTPPPVGSAYGWWLATTPYGAQLRALLSVVANVGLYFGGLPETLAFRKVGGYFGNGRF